MKTITQAQIKIAPSILAADFSKLGEEIKSIAAAGADYVHVDVMDGHFVPNITIGPVVVKWLKKVSPLPLDVHLMITDPRHYAPEFIKAGADILTFHYEACENDRELRETIGTIRLLGVKVGLVVKPRTPAEALFPYLADLDMVLIMSVEPGFGGQKFIPEALDKSRKLRAEAGPNFDIEMDGGIYTTNVAEVKAAGTNVIVAGTAVFGAPDRADAIVKLREG